MFVLSRRDLNNKVVEQMFFLNPNSFWWRTDRFDYIAAQNNETIQLLSVTGQCIGATQFWADNPYIRFQK